MTEDRLTQSLVEAAKRGDQAARESLVALTRASLLAHVQRRLGSHLRSRLEADDVIQETYAKALASLTVFEWRGNYSFVRWLHGIASNEILRLTKREGRRRFIATENDDVEDGGVSPSRGLRREERSRRLKMALDELSPEHREVIVLARLKGMPLAVVGERMGRTPNAVAQLLRRALTKLKESFGDTESLGLLARPRGPSDSGGQDGR